MAELERSVGSEAFPQVAERAVEALRGLPPGSGCVVAVVKFIEEHPKQDLGCPGALVHFLESCPAEEYDAVLLASVRRSPTIHTLWMLNRVVNSVREEELEAYLRVLEAICNDQRVAVELRAEAGNVLDLFEDSVPGD